MKYHFAAAALPLLASAASATDLEATVRKLAANAQKEPSQSQRSLSACSEIYGEVLLGSILGTGPCGGDNSVTCITECANGIKDVQSTCTPGEVAMSTDDGTGDTLYSSAIFGVSGNMYIPGCADEFSYAYGPRDCEAAFEVYAIGLFDVGPCAHEAGATTCLAACDALITDIMGDVCQDGDTMSMEGNEETKYPGNAAFALYAGTYYPQCKSALAPGRSTFGGVAAGAAAMAIASIFLA